MPRKPSPEHDTYSSIGREMLRHPVRMRIAGWLAGKSGGHTQREIGKALSMSTAAVHYHIKLLEGIDLVEVTSTRAGPNGITEKLYTIDARKFEPLTEKDKAGFYVEYAISHMHEMQREAGQMLEEGKDHHGYVVGSFEAFAPKNEISKFKNDLVKRIQNFYEKHRKMKKGTSPVAITFGVMPSNGAGWTGSQRLMDFA